MTIALASIPRFDPAEALQVLNRDYGIDGPISALPSERDQNFLVDQPGHGKFVLKIANRDDGRELLEFQHEAMRRVAARAGACRVQDVVPARSGGQIQSLRSSSGDLHQVRVMRWLEGDVLAKCRPRGAALFESIGTSMAEVDLALCGYEHPAMHRHLQWDLRRAGDAREHIGLLPRARRARVERAFGEWDAIDWQALRFGVIHGDANDYNVLVTMGRMTGLLDFGDIVRSATVCELAIALAYAILEEREPLLAAGHLVRAYDRRSPLNEAEWRALYPLLISRLCASVCYAAHNRARNPHDPYQVVTEAGAWDLLDAFEEVQAGDLLVSCRA
jgi:Ser/Thr protein kinase RdoA (MazF antagonist)